MHKMLYKFFTGYGYATLFISIMVLSTIYSISSQRNTFAADDFAKRFEEHCLERKSAIRKASCADPGGHILGAYLAFTPVSKEPNLKNVQDLLRLFALRNDKESAQKSFDKLKQDKLDEPKFMMMLKDAITWGEQEKSKSAEELYQLSKTMPNQIEEINLQESYKRTYLMLATRKGHVKAQEEIDEILK